LELINGYWLLADQKFGLELIDGYWLIRCLVWN